MPLVVFTEILREIIEHKGISGDKLMRIGIYVFFGIVNHRIFLRRFMSPARYIRAFHINFQRGVAGCDNRIAVPNERNRIFNIKIEIFLFFFGIRSMIGFICVAPGMRGERKRIIAGTFYDDIGFTGIRIKKIRLSAEISFRRGRI